MIARRGFTAIELIIVVLIIGILTAGAAPRVVHALRLSRLDSACRRIQADLAWVRQIAISQSASQSVQFTTGTGSYAVVGRSSLDRASNAYVVELDEAPYRCTINSAALGADATIIFDRYGQPDSGGTIVVGSGSAVRTVTVNATTAVATSS